MKKEGAGERSSENERPDEELVGLAQGGDKQATEELLSRYAGLVRGRARGFFPRGRGDGGSHPGRDDRIVPRRGEYRPDREGSMSFKNFASLCVSRRIIDAVKASARKKNVPLNNYVSLFQSEWEMPVSSPEEEVIRGEDRREFLQKMGRELSDFEFRVTVMYMDGFSCAEICEATGRGEKSVDNAIQRSKKKLQKLLGR